MDHYIYKTAYRGISYPRTWDTVTLQQNLAQPIVTISIKIIAFPANVSIRSFIDNNFIFPEKNKVLCNIYIYSTYELDTEILRSINDKINTINKEEPDVNLLISKNAMHYNTIGTLNSAKEAINMFPSIILHISHYDDDNYHFKDMQSLEDKFSLNCIEYIHFNKRNKRTLLHGDVTYNGHVNIFHGYFIKYVPKVIILNDEWQIVKSTNHKIAMKLVNNLYIWIVTFRNTFITHSNYEPAVFPMAASIIPMNELTNTEINYLMKLYANMEFENLKFTEKSIYSIDAENDILMFSGVLTELELGHFYDTLKHYI